MSHKIINKFSARITQDITQGASQAMLYALGMKKEDMKKAQVGISSVYFAGNPCNNHLNILSDLTKKSVNQHKSNQIIGLPFYLPGVSDGISMGTVGMKYSLPSRELISDSIETMMMGHSYDANISIAGCDKNLPGCLMGILKVNRPSAIIYGGSIKPGVHNNKEVNIVDAFQSYGLLKSGKINEEQHQSLIKSCCPGSGACGGMYTANTMAIALEVMGIILPNSSSNIALSEQKLGECKQMGDIIYQLLKEDLCPREIITEKSVTNAIKAVITVGGSTNAVLHLLAIANIIDLDINLEDFNTIGKDVPVYGNFKPFGDYLMNDLNNIGGTSKIIKYLLEENILDGSTNTITTKTLADNYENTFTDDLRNSNQDVFLIDNPIKKDSHIRIFYGNLAPDGAVGKITGKEGNYFKGKALVFESEDEFLDYIKVHNIKDNVVIVIRNQGPKGGPGMPEMLKPTSAIAGLGIEDKVAFITDGRFSGGSHGFIIGHVTPEAYSGGNIALVQNGDIIEIDAVNNIINLDISSEELNIRKKNTLYNWYPNKIRNENAGILNRFRKNVTPASVGCFTL